MIISHKHKFIFLRPMRVGSLSTQTMIIESGILGENDLHSGMVDNSFAENYLNVKLPKDYLNNKAENPKMLKARLMHSTGDYLVQEGLLTNTQLKEYTLITILREPIERYISAWFFEVVGSYFAGDLREGFKDFVKKDPKLDLIDHSNYSKYLRKGSVTLNTASLKKDLSTLLGSYDGTIKAYRKDNISPFNCLAKEDLSQETVLILENYLKKDYLHYKERYAC